MLVFVFLFIAVTIAPARAQQDQDVGRASRIELYGGYDHIRFNINASPSVLQPPSEVFNANCHPEAKDQLLLFRQGTTSVVP